VNHKMQHIYSVRELNKHAKICLEEGFPSIQVKGEISNLARPASKHLYFTLKDDSAQIKCAYFKHLQSSWSQKNLENGQSVVLAGRVTLYEPRGDYQLIVTDIIPDGEGLLLQQIEQLKQKLKAEGLFDLSSKRPVPSHPETIGIITSGSGAAIHDILTTLCKRYPIAKVRLYCAEVQGKLASKTIIKALHEAIREKQCHVLIIARGGGSLEDLMPFNDEQLAREIYHCPIPIISGVGHETDVTICDFVSDYRAATPTAAAQASCPDKVVLQQHIRYQVNKLQQLLKQKVLTHQQILAWHPKQLLTPTALLFNHRWQTIDYLQLRLNQSVKKIISEKQNILNIRLHQIHKLHPKQVIQSFHQQCSFIRHKLLQTIRTNLNSKNQRFENLMVTLHALSPLATLKRGYSITTHQNTVITNPSQVSNGDSVVVRVNYGTLSCQVTQRETIDE